MRGRLQESLVSKRPRLPPGEAAAPCASVKRSRSADDANYRQPAFPADRRAHSAGPALYCSDPGPRGPGFAWASRCDARFGSWLDGPGRGGWWGGGHAVGPRGCDSALLQSESGGVRQCPGVGQGGGAWRGPGAGPGAAVGPLGRWDVGQWDGAWWTTPHWHGHGGGMLRDEWMQVLPSRQAHANARAHSRAHFRARACARQLTHAVPSHLRVQTPFCNRQPPLPNSSA